MKKLVPVAFIIAAIVIAGFLYQKYRLAPGIKFEALELTDLKGNAVKLQNYHDKKLFINFFATWCGACIEELPALDRAAEILAPDNFVFIAVSDEPLPLLNRASERLSLQRITILRSAKKLKQLDIVTYPTSYLLNVKGNVVFKKTNEADWASTEMIELLKQKAQ
jgi:thiol-disulfide isomerase/thioredoxin